MQGATVRNARKTGVQYKEAFHKIKERLWIQCRNGGMIFTSGKQCAKIVPVKQKSGNRQCITRSRPCLHYRNVQLHGPGKTWPRCSCDRLKPWDTLILVGSCCPKQSS